MPVTCGVDPEGPFTVLVVGQSSPLGVPMPRPIHTVDGTPVPPTLVSVTFTVPFSTTVNE